MVRGPRRALYGCVSVMTETRATKAHIGCRRHPFDVAVAVCQKCRSSHCSDCVVFPFGSRKPARCIPCAIVAGGIRRR